MNGGEEEYRREEAKEKEKAIENAYNCGYKLGWRDATAEAEALASIKCADLLSSAANCWIMHPEKDIVDVLNEVLGMYENYHVATRTFDKDYPIQIYMPFTLDKDNR